MGGAGKCSAVSQAINGLNVVSCCCLRRRLRLRETEHNKTQQQSEESMWWVWSHLITLSQSVSESESESESGRAECGGVWEWKWDSRKQRGSCFPMQNPYPYPPFFSLAVSPSPTFSPFNFFFSHLLPNIQNSNRIRLSNQVDLYNVKLF